MKLKRIAALLLCFALLLNLAGCKKDASVQAPPQTQPVVTEAPVPEAGELYAAARAAVDNAADLQVRVAVEKTTEAGTTVYLETSNQVITYLGRGTDATKVLLSEVVSYGEDYYIVTYQDVFAGGQLYSLVNGESRLACAATAADVEAELVPAVLLDASLYGSVELQKENGRYVITFAQPTAGESWALPEGAELVEASGSAEVNTDGSLYKTSYTITYTYGAARITEQYNALPALETGTVEVPADADKYTQMDDLRAVRMSEQACGVLMQSPSVSSTISKTMTSLAGAVSRTETNSVKLSLENGLIASVDTSVNLTDLSSNESESYTLEETFWGEYSYREDGGEKQTDSSVDAQAMYEYSAETLLDGMIALDYWKNAQIQDLGDLYLVEFTFNDQLAADLRADTCQTLLGDSGLLDEYSTETAVVDVSGYFAVDKYTGMPTAAAYSYSGTDVIEGESYVIGMQSVQSYLAPDDGAYYALTEETLEEEAPENKATPLLYKVTGAEGQKMYLMGTIHVGDARTAYLPQEVYDALDDSSALAVEFDLVDFEKKLETDADLQAAAAASYYYLDGTTVVDHADQELLEKAEAYMKATGNYNSMLAFMKPGMWAQSLQNSFLRQGYSLSGQKGVDRRLILRAYENDMMVVDIESGEEQMEMLGGFSDELQELLLEEAVSYEPGEYWQEVAELYEMWCRGDETELKAYLNDTSDQAEMSAEEQALYEEYQTAMITLRNDAMLEEAEAYLETGHTIFFAVGLAHLLQDNGLVDGLRNAGYTVELVAYN